MVAIIRVSQREIERERGIEREKEMKRKIIVRYRDILIDGVQ